MLDSVDSKGSNRVIFAIFRFNATQSSYLIRGKRYKVFILRLAGNVFNQNVDLFSRKALLDRNDMHQVVILKDWWGLEVGGQRGDREGAARTSQEAQKRRYER